MKQKFWAKDWFAAVAFSFAFAIVAYGTLGDGFQSLERYAYDLGVRARERTPSDKVAVIAIDDESIKNLGRWPWPRNLHAAMLDLLRDGGARAIGNTIFYYEAQEDPGLRYVNEIGDWLAKSALTTRIPAEIEAFGAMLGDQSANKAIAPVAQAYRDSALVAEYAKELEALNAKLVEARSFLSVDRVLAESLRKGPRTTLSMSFELGQPVGRPDAPLPDYVRKNALTRIVDRVEAKANGWLPFPTVGVLYPLQELGEAATTIGHLSLTVDLDGAIRFEPLVLQHYDELYPSLSLMLAAQALNLGPQDIEVRLGEGVALGGLNIGTTADLRMYTHYYRDRGGRPPFQVDSFFDVFSGKIPASKYKDKVVLIGPAATGIGDNFPTPVAANMPPVVALAHSVSSILQQDFFTRPDWAGLAEFLLYVAIAAYLALLVPLLGPGLGAGITGGLVFVLLATQLTLMAGSALWVKFVIPAILLLTGHAFMMLKRLRLTEMLKASSEQEGAESNRMLGLAFQGQGQLDMAFEKFRRVQPVDDKVLDLMYNLALDFERKRQFNKAEAVYQHIAQHNKGFKDIEQKLSRAKKLSETVILGGSATSHPGGTLVLDATQQVEKPMLGRYQVEKELGKGAMGIVYMGKDPKIGRTVAIKTMALSQEFEPDELADVKSRFFREAETAGRLNHPNIVQIFDAGEEHDLAYIAMEFIKGHDLTKHVKPNGLLPVKEAVKYVADAADALDYAHSNGIVHRDIKPANMMLMDSAKTIKLMDFGIARIADSSKTKTGMVLGTPSYMSPEQLSGKKVDGRSDLFSLGVTLYQLLTGALPFQADSMATLMFKIANEPHPKPSVIRPDLPKEVDGIVDKALAKDFNQRYQRGGDFARDLRAVLGTLA
ncbi:MAG: CHASE2 domain-containing protein [Gammaproteobacteria bacterium]|nr:CHASE2 domain-containing protein [Gammaproteobacteria bacterium]